MQCGQSCLGTLCRYRAGGRCAGTFDRRPGRPDQNDVVEFEPPGDTLGDDRPGYVHLVGPGPDSPPLHCVGPEPPLYRGHVTRQVHVPRKRVHPPLVTDEKVVRE